MTSPTVRIDVVTGPSRGSELVFGDHDVLVVGSAPDCHVVLPARDPAAAAHHLLLEVNPPRVRVRDLGTGLGTVVNGVTHGGAGSPVTAATGGATVELRDGDEVRVGTSLLRVRVTPPAGVAGHDTRAASSDPDALIARILGEAGADRLAVPGYELRAVLGTGGFGAVHLARHRASGRLVALKVLLPGVAVETGTRDRFRREIEVHAGLAHPNVAALHEHGEAGGAFWFTMEYCEGGSLARHIQAAGGRLGLAEVAPLMRDTLAGLATAHRRGVVHRDVKPHNILLARGAGSGWVAKISDFGLARSVVETGMFGMTTTDGQAGSWPYMPREQLLDYRDVRPATDVWSVAATFYEVLAGVPPRDLHGARDPVTAVLESRPAPLRSRVPGLPGPVAEVLDRALEVDVARRHTDADELRADLAAALDESGVPTT